MEYKAYWLTNVRLEQGFEREAGQISRTITGIYHIRIQDGVIAEVVEAGSDRKELNNGLPQYDGNGMLLLPSFEDGHIHLDKTYYDAPWKAVKPISSIFERIEEERQLLPQLLPQSQRQAESILTLIQSLGTTAVRTHCNIEPVSGLHRLEATKRALDTFSGKLSADIVAFPQHGLFRSHSVELMKQAMAEGATLVGGVDPYTIDGDIEKSLQTIVELAVSSNAGIDIHLHEGGESAKLTLERLAELTEEAGLQGQVTVSHAFWFAFAGSQEAQEMAGRMASLGMSIASTVPIGGLMMPLPMLLKQGVNVKLGTDSLTDHWSPFGNGDQLEKAGRLAELYGYNDEQALAQALGYITGGITPLDSEGKQVWPRAGHAASFVLVQASCSAEAVARRSKRLAVWHEGKLVSGSL